MKKHRFGQWLTALVLGFTLVGTPALAAAAMTPAAATPLAAPSDDTSPSKAPSRPHAYAEREAASPRAADFKGNGSEIYIGGSTLAVVLVVVLIVVLL